jgi:hypothetical protein
MRLDKIEGEVMPQAAYVTWGTLSQPAYPNGRFDPPTAGKRLGSYIRVLTPVLGQREIVDIFTFTKERCPVRFSILGLIHDEFPNYWYKGWIKAD